MGHTSEGVLRRLLDEPAGVPATDREHAAGCPQCVAALAAMRDDATLVHAALTPEPGPEVDVDAGWRRLSAATPAVPAAGTPVPAGRPSGARARAGRSWAAFVRRPAVAALAAVVVLTGVGTAAANGWLQIFRTEEVQPISVSTADLVSLPDLSSYGDVSLVSEPSVHEVPDASAAAAESGLDVPEVADLPRGVSGEPLYQVGGQATATFTFSAARAAEAAAEAGEPLPPVPPGLDGSQVRLVAGPGVAQVWTSDAGAPALVVGHAVAPTAFSSGVPFETVRDYLLSVPGLPELVAADLRTFTADGSTLPLLLPADEVTTSSADVDGAEATVLETRDRTLAAVVWVEDGEVTAVAGSLDVDEVLSIARNLR
jgi:hypothetical protein